MSKEKKRIKYKGIIECPYCEARINLEVGDIITIPSTPAEKEEYINVEKDSQTN